MKPTAATLANTASTMTEQDNAVVGKDALKVFIGILAHKGIKTYCKVHKHHNHLAFQYFAKVGWNLVPIGYEEKRSLKMPSVIKGYTLKFWYSDDSGEYHYEILAYCDADAVEAAVAFCANRFIAQGCLWKNAENENENSTNFIWTY